MAIAVIPSRYASKRFKGKPLARVNGKPMIQRVYEQAIRASTIDHVVVATDDERIFNTVRQFGGEALMTPSGLRSGTDRVWEACRQLAPGPDEVIINIQGDQPVFSPECLTQLTAPFNTDDTVNMSTLAVETTDESDWADPASVKVVINKRGNALYFSRSLIPFARDGKPGMPVYRHLGFYAYRHHFLGTIAGMEESLLESTEKLEQLRVLDHGYDIRVVVTDHDSPSVDRPEDISRIETTYF